MATDSRLKNDPAVRGNNRAAAHADNRASRETADRAVTQNREVTNIRIFGEPYPNI